VTFVLAQVADAVKIPNAALRFKPSREQMQALRDQMGGGSGGHHRGSGSDGGSGGPRNGGGGSGMGGGGNRDAQSGASGNGGQKRDFGDKKPVYKLVDGRPKMVLIKPGLTDGSSTEMLEGDLKPGDQLVTEITGIQAPPRKVGAF
jgi:HlyD family secretion protein